MVQPQPQPEPSQVQSPSHPIADRTLALLSAHYQIVGCLDSNPFDTTFEMVVGETPKLLKVLNPKPSRQPKAVRLFEEEAELLKDIDSHPGIPEIDDTRSLQEELQESDPFLHYLIVEKMEGIPLTEWMESRGGEPITQDVAIAWLKQIVEILAIVHDHNFIHQNIKPKNILLKPDGQLALINFWLERQNWSERQQDTYATRIVTPGYIPAEQTNLNACPQSDFFALGRTFVYLLTGYSPSQIPESPRNGRLSWRRKTSDLSRDFMDLIDHLIDPFPGNRPPDAGTIVRKIDKIAGNNKFGNGLNLKAIAARGNRWTKEKIKKITDQF
ncbi:protein kinase [Lyngbya sp. CCY1209]|uniref:serine/threonine protein kinase n=1 Tax=Lyngbya sp. CCY1209 TaxID=2886103 RepID=UPI002D206582|nr:protein kinase [Lyngbya sp. CCY1209]MEB3886693.1 protein kinase [Lyngbya sp. CCY1209]